MRICKRCLYSELHPLHLVFDHEGICSGCRVHEEKDFLNWNHRSSKLQGLLNEYKSKSGNNYDCIVPVSGGRDSYFIVHTLKMVYGMNPLLVTYNKHYNTDVGIRNLANLRIKMDCDLFTLTVNPEIAKKITRATLRKMGSIYWHCIAGQTVFPVQIAVRLKIPLIVWGVHQGVDQVGMFSHLDEVEMTRKYRKEHDLMGFEAEDLVDEFDSIKQSDIMQYRYPEDKEIERVGVRGIYLGNYLRWDSRDQHEQMIEKYGYETFPQNRTFDSYNDVDCFNYSDLHDYIKFLKYGYGKATDHACREIRLHKISRQQGLDLVREHSSQPLRNLDLFLKWIGMTREGLRYILDQHRSKAIWERNDHWEWQVKESVLESQNPSQLESLSHSAGPTHKPFLLTELRKKGCSEDRYVLIGRGYTP